MPSTLSTVSLVTISLGLFLFACSSSSTSTPSSTSDGGGSTNGEDGATSSSSDAGSDAPAGTMGGGAINLFSGKSTSTLVAVFAGPSASGLTPGCTIEEVGVCNLLACASLDAGPPAPKPALLNAGTLTATGGLIQGDGIVVVPNASDEYPAFSGGTFLWTGGESITFTATGGSYPAFTKTVTAPTAGVSISTPTVTSGSGLIVPRSSDLVFQWAIGSSPGVGKLSILLSTAATTGSRSLSCSFDVAPGTGAVPSAALSKLEAGPGTLSFGVSATTTTTVGDYSLMIDLVTPVVASGTDITFVSTTLE